MPITATSDTTAKSQAPYYKHLIRCPGHWLVPPQVDVYLREPVSLLKRCSDWIEFRGNKIKLKKTRIATDKWGRKKLDWKKLYELRAKGIVLNPMISASYAIEHIWDPYSLLCMRCKKSCREGKGTISELTIKRLTR